MRLRYQFTEYDLNELPKIEKNVRNHNLFMYFSWPIFALLGLGLCLFASRITGVITYSILSAALLVFFLSAVRKALSKVKDQALSTERVVELHETYYQSWAGGVETRTAWWWVTSFETHSGFWILRHDETFVGVIPRHAVPEQDRDKVESLIRERVDRAQESDDALGLDQVNWHGERMRCAYDISRDEFIRIFAESETSHDEKTSVKTPDNTPKSNRPLMLLAAAGLVLICLVLVPDQQLQFDLEGLMFGVIVFVVAAAIWFSILVFASKRMNARAAAKRSDDEIEGETTCIWTAEGIALVTRCGATLLSWRGIKRVSQTELTIRLERKDFHFSFIPKRIFDNDESRISEFVESISQCVETAGSEPPVVLP